jgi:hypothetical protein
VNAGMSEHAIKHSFTDNLFPLLLQYFDLIPVLHPIIFKGWFMVWCVMFNATFKKNFSYIVVVSFIGG